MAALAVLRVVFRAGAFLAVDFAADLAAGFAARLAGVFRGVGFLAAVLPFARTVFLAAGFALFGAATFLDLALRAAGEAGTLVLAGADFAVTVAGFLAAGFDRLGANSFSMAFSLISIDSNAFLSGANSFLSAFLICLAFAI